MPDEELKTKRTLIPVPVLAKLPTKNLPPFAVVGTDLIAQTESGSLTISLRVPTKLVPQLEDLPPLEQLTIILQSRGEQETIDALGELDTIDTNEIVRKFWQAFGEREDARLGESFTSSAS